MQKGKLAIFTAGALKLEVLKAAAPHVPTHGFNHQSLDKGVEDLLGLCDENSQRFVLSLRHSLPNLFDRGVPTALVEYYVQGSNQSAKALLLTKFDARTGLANFNSPADVPTESTVARAALGAKLNFLVPVLHQWPRAVRIESLPTNVPFAVKALAEFADDVMFFCERMSAVRRYLESEEAVLNAARANGGNNPIVDSIRSLRKENVGEFFPLSKGPHVAEGMLGIDWYLKRARISAAYLACITCAVGESNGRPISQVPNCMGMVHQLL